MKLRRTSIAGLMVAVAVCGIGLASLRDPSRTWEVVMKTAAVALVLGAAIGAFARRGRARFAWAGFAVYGIIGLGPNPMLELNGLLPDYLLSLIFESPIPAGPLSLPPAVEKVGYQSRTRRLLGALGFAAIGATVGALVYRGPEEDGSDPS